MYRLLLQRLASIIGILLVVTIGTFVLIKLSPIDPVAMKFNLVGATPDPVLVEQIREQLGLNDPWWQQYIRWLGQLVRGDFGESILYSLPVATLLGGALPNTLGLVSLTLLMGVVVTIPLGMLSARYQDSWGDHVIAIYVLRLGDSGVLGRSLAIVFIRREAAACIGDEYKGLYRVYTAGLDDCSLDLRLIHSPSAQCYSGG